MPDSGPAMMRTDSAKGITPQEGEVWVKMRETREQISYIDSLVENLAVRLRAFVDDKSPGIANSEEKRLPSSCDFCLQIDENNQILAGIGRRLAYLQNNLQI